MANEFDIFSVSVKDLDTGDRPQTTSDLYTPKPDQGSDGTYRSLIRFLPNAKIHVNLSFVNMSTG